MGKQVAIVQSSYIPWKGYFDLIGQVDEFVLYDDAQFTRLDWRNRNLVKTQHGLRWLTIPVRHRAGQTIADALISKPDWNKTHLRTLSHAFARAPYFGAYRSWLEALYLDATTPSLSEVNHLFIREICKVLGIRTKLSRSADYALRGGRTERLVNLCRDAGATDYLTGHRARGYLEVSAFEQAGITVTFVDYAGYPEYRQLFPPFEHRVTVLDLIMNEGPSAPRYLRRGNISAAPSVQT